MGSGGKNVSNGGIQVEAMDFRLVVAGAGVHHTERSICAKRGTSWFWSQLLELNVFVI